MNVLEKIQEKLKTIEIITIILAIITILMSQFEYEFWYYPIFYNNNVNNYKGDYIRLIYSVITVLLSKD